MVGVTLGLPMAAGRFQQLEGADDIVFDEVGRGIDGAVHMGFRGQMDDGAGGMLSQDGVQGGAVTDVGPHEDMGRIHGGKGIRAGGITQTVQRHHLFIAAADQGPGQSRANETGGPRQQKRHGVGSGSSVQKVFHHAAMK